jgi:hypothetical protein
MVSTKGTTNFSQSNATSSEMLKMSGVTANQSVRQSMQTLISEKIPINVSLPGHNHSISHSSRDASWMTSVKKNSKKLNGHQLSINS